MTERVIVIGLDGATFDLILPWAAEGKLPNIARTLREGAYGILRSTVPPMTAPAWTTFMTGRNVGKHGIADFLLREPESYNFRVVNASHRKTSTLWGYLSNLGKRVGVLNVPMTYPPEPVNGFLVAGMDTPSPQSPFTYPPTLREEILSRFPGYTIEVRAFPLLFGHRRDPTRLVRELIRSEQERYRLGQFLRDRCPCDLFTVVFRSTDLVQHWFWKSMDPHHPHYEKGDGQYADAILEVYQHVDRLIGHYLLEGSTLVIVSDHGAGPIGDRVVHLNTWLRDQGWLSFKPHRGRTLQKGLWKAWKYVRGSTPPVLRKVLLRRFLRVRQRIPSFFALSDIDWSRTLVYSLEVRGTIWINLKGREPKGIVSPGTEYESLRDEVAKRLLELRDPVTGEPLVAKVYKREDLYQGPYLDLIPDLLPVWAGNPYAPMLLHGSFSRRDKAIEILTAEELAQLGRPNAGHRLNGICIFWGKGIRPGAHIEGARLQDVMPTILHLMGLPIPKDVDGRVLGEALLPSAGEPLPSHSEASIAHESASGGYNEQEEKEMLDRLSDLGYI